MNTSTRTGSLNVLQKEFTRLLRIDAPFEESILVVHMLAEQLGDNIDPLLWRLSYPNRTPVSIRVLKRAAIRTRMTGILAKCPQNSKMEESAVVVYMGKRDAQDRSGMQPTAMIGWREFGECSDWLMQSPLLIYTS